MTTDLVNLLKKVKKKKQPETLAFEIYREQRDKLHISLAVNAILFVVAILTIIFSWTSRKRGIK